MLTLIGGQWKRRRLILPPQTITRPTSQRCKEAVFNILEHHYHVTWSKQRVLDSFAGSGSIGFEALSRGAALSHFYECNAIVVTILRRNQALLHAQKVSDIYHRNILHAGPPLLPYTMVWIDPPYDLGLEDLLLTKMSGEQGWITPDTLIILERRYVQGAKKEPEGFKVQQARSYGEAEILFLTLT